MRVRARRVLLFACIIVVQFILFEAALRRWGSSEAAPAFQGLFTGDATIGYRPQPGARVHYATDEFATDLAINQAGVRDSEELAPKKTGEKRILILGDSLVLSVQVPFEQTFGERLEHMLNDTASPNIRYRVVNAGVQGYGPVEELLFFRKLLAVVDPDFVVVTVFVGNDAEEAVGSEPKLSAQGDTEALRDSVVTTARRTVRRSMVLQVLRLRAVAALGRFQGFSAPPEPPHQSYAANPPVRIARGIEITRDCIDRMAREAEAAGAKTGIALMPARFQLDDGDYGRLRQMVADLGGELVRDAATDRFAEGLAPLSLPMTDLLVPLRAAGGRQDLFFQRNVHLTPKGHEVVAEHLATFVRSHGL
jgi:lysophospholipase L1-like esterase